MKSLSKAMRDVCSCFHQIIQDVGGDGNHIDISIDINTYPINMIVIHVTNSNTQVTIAKPFKFDEFIRFEGDLLGLKVKEMIEQVQE